jgi:CHAD domain-containing protein
VTTAPAAAIPAPALPVEAYARRQLERLGRSAKQARQIDPDAIHDARVASRRLDAALDVLLARGPEEKRGDEERALRRLRRSLGRLREREVIAQSLRSLLDAASLPAREAGELLLGRLAKRITRGRRRAVERIQVVHKEILALRAAAELKSVPDTDAMSRGALRWSAIRRAEAERRLAKALRSQDEDDLHEARLAVKKWRYALEVLVEASGAPADAEQERVIALQRSLGSIHDGDVLLDYLRRWSRRWRDDGSRELATAVAPLVRRLGASRRRELRQLPRLAATLQLPVTSAAPVGS